MSIEVVETLLREVGKDVGLAAMLGADPGRLTQYDLEPKELAALIARDFDALCEMGVDSDLAENVRFIGLLTG